MRRVVSLWLPRFATDRLSRGHPDWRDSPLVTTAEAQGRLLLAAVNGAAAGAGLESGMALADARAILPAVRTVESDPAGDAHVLTRLAAWSGRYSPWIAVDASGAEQTKGGDASIRLDVTGCTHLFGGEEALLADLTGRLASLGFANRAAVADTPGAAWAMARHAAADRNPWTVVPSEGTREALAPLPVAALRLASRTVAALDTLGLRRIGDLLPLPRAALAARFREEVARRLDEALGRRPEPISPGLAPAPHFARLAFPEPVARTDDIAAALDHLLRLLCAGLEGAHHGARRLVFSLYEPDGGVRRVAVGVGRPSRDPEHLAHLFAERLDGIEAEFGFDSVTLSAPVTEALGAAQTGLAPDGARYQPASVDRLTDRLSNRLGAASVLRPVPHESHIPERAVRAMTVLKRARLKQPVSWPHERPFARPRPPRLLARPEPVEAVAPVPDDPPVLFRWRRATFRVVRADGPERIAPEWWLSDGDRYAEGRESLRDYYRVEDTAGRRFWLYREGLYRADRHPAWYLHGVDG